MDTFIGFDSAWTDNPKAPGTITAVCFQGDRVVSWSPPELVSFDRGLAFIQAAQSTDGATIVALDQPTIVANAVGMRPALAYAAAMVINATFMMAPLLLLGHSASVAIILSPSLAASLFPWLLLPGFLAGAAPTLWLLIGGVNVESWTRQRQISEARPV